MKKYEIRLDTLKEVNNFCEVVNKAKLSNVDMELKNDKCFSVDARSRLGLIYASAEFKNLFLYSSHDIYDEIKDFVV